VYNPVSVFAHAKRHWKIACLDEEEGQMIEIRRDRKGQAYIQWEQAPGGYKRAWIQHKGADEKDWAETGRYLNVVRTTGPDSGPAGNATDFPIFSELPDEQILEAFVAAVCAVTGCKIPT
jgi:hypothetical protein